MVSGIHFKYWEKYFDFATLRAIFTKLLIKGSTMVPEKIFRLLKYEHVIYSFEARDQEISNM